MAERLVAVPKISWFLPGTAREEHRCHRDTEPALPRLHPTKVRSDRLCGGGTLIHPVGSWPSDEPGAAIRSICSGCLRLDGGRTVARSFVLSTLVPAGHPLLASGRRCSQSKRTWLSVTTTPLASRSARLTGRRAAARDHTVVVQLNDRVRGPSRCAAVTVQTPTRQIARLGFSHASVWRGRINTRRRSIIRERFVADLRPMIDYAVASPTQL